MFETDHCFQLLNKICCERTSSLLALKHEFKIKVGIETPLLIKTTTAS